MGYIPIVCIGVVLHFPIRKWECHDFKLLKAVLPLRHHEVQTRLHLFNIRTHTHQDHQVGGQTPVAPKVYVSKMLAETSPGWSVTIQSSGNFGTFEDTRGTVACTHGVPIWCQGAKCLIWVAMPLWGDERAQSLSSWRCPDYPLLFLFGVSSHFTPGYQGVSCICSQVPRSNSS